MQADLLRLLQRTVSYEQSSMCFPVFHVCLNEYAISSVHANGLTD